MKKLKIEQLQDGVVVNRSWLKDKNIDSSLVDYYLRKGYLTRVAYGAYRTRTSELLKTCKELLQDYRERTIGYDLDVASKYQQVIDKAEGTTT